MNAPSYDYALNILDCDTACGAVGQGIQSAMANATTQLPSLSSGVWADHHYAQIMHLLFRTTTITCPGPTYPGFVTYPNMQVGVLYGRLAGSTYATSGLVPTWEFFDSTGCDSFGAPIYTLPTNIAIHLRLVRGTGSMYTASAFLGSWTTLGSHTMSNGAYTYGRSLQVGQELYGVVASSNVHSPLNAWTNITMQYTGNGVTYPWHDNILPSPLQGHSYRQVGTNYQDFQSGAASYAFLSGNFTSQRSVTK